MEGCASVAFCRSGITPRCKGRSSFLVAPLSATVMPRYMGYGETMEEAIAEISLIGVSKSGREFPIEVAVGKPRPHDEFDWACSVFVMGLESRPHDIYGNDALQALCLGLRMVRVHLSSFLENGGQLLDPEDRSPFPLSAYFHRPELGEA